MTLVDDADYERLSQFKWTYHPIRIRGKAYQGYAKAYMGKKQRPMELHRLLMPDKPDHVVDHINRDKLDNRRKNLRYLTWSESNRNIVRCDNKTGFPGVRKDAKGWGASASFNGVRYYRQFHWLIDAVAWRLHLLWCAEQGQLPEWPLLHPRNNSGVRGVYRMPEGLWMARFRHNKRKVYLGRFRTCEAATAAVKAYFQ